MLEQDEERHYLIKIPNATIHVENQAYHKYKSRRWC